MPLNMSSPEYYAMMFGAYQAMPEKEKADLHAWEREHLDGSQRFATSDWPGWEKYIGKPPLKDSPALQDKKKQSGFVYLVFARTGEHKIGCSIDPGSRIKPFSVQPPFEYELIHTFPADDMRQAEIVLHDKFANKRIRINAEWFSLNSNDINWIQSIIGFQNGRFIQKSNLPS
jgi:hypothetical protein